ncbi:hypothetical protein HanPSC8_Chr12g0508831 [Helianthus annuus]|nr:hypothetical protein HanPSC8_Chr12g0508831 [Helianthus annuus]
MRYKVQNRRDRLCTFGKIWGLNAIQSAIHRDRLCTFGKLGTKSKTLENHWDYNHFKAKSETNGCDATNLQSPGWLPLMSGITSVALRYLATTTASVI